MVRSASSCTVTVAPGSDAKDIAVLGANCNRRHPNVYRVVEFIAAVKLKVPRPKVPTCRHTVGLISLSRGNGLGDIAALNMLPGVLVAHNAAP